MQLEYGERISCDRHPTIGEQSNMPWNVVGSVQAIVEREGPNTPVRSVMDRVSETVSDAALSSESVVLFVRHDTRPNLEAISSPMSSMLAHGRRVMPHRASAAPK